MSCPENSVLPGKSTETFLLLFESKFASGVYSGSKFFPNLDKNFKAASTPPGSSFPAALADFDAMRIHPAIRFVPAGGRRLSKLGRFLTSA